MFIYYLHKKESRLTWLHTIYVKDRGIKCVPNQIIAPIMYAYKRHTSNNPHDKSSILPWINLIYSYLLFI